MANLSNLMVPLAINGNHFSIYTGRTRDGRVYANATEGKLSDNGRSFTYELFGNTRSIRYENDGPAKGTKKTIHNVVVKLLSLLLANGLITDEARAAAVADIPNKLK